MAREGVGACCHRERAAGNREAYLTGRGGRETTPSFFSGGGVLEASVCICICICILLLLAGREPGDEKHLPLFGAHLLAEACTRESDSEGRGDLLKETTVLFTARSILVKNICKQNIRFDSSEKYLPTVSREERHDK